MKTFTASLFLFLLPACFAQDNKVKPKQSVVLTDFAFISGHNRGELDGGIIDEHWSEPAGDSMMGVYRYIRDGKVEMYELLVIEQTTTGPVLRLKHFNPGLVGWEEKGEVWSFPLAHFTPGEAVFARPDNSLRITYRAAGNNVLESTLERTGKKTEVFQFKHSSD
jgi:hypothetical protein